MDKSALTDEQIREAIWIAWQNTGSMYRPRPIVEFDIITFKAGRASMESALAEANRERNPLRVAQASRDAAVRLWNETGEELLATQGALVGLLDAIAGANIPVSLAPESRELTHACVRARRVLAASGEGDKK